MQPLAPTLSLAQSEIYIDQLLKDNVNCELPCFWTLTPGKTSYNEAVQFFKHLGWRGSDYETDNGLTYETGKDLKNGDLSIRIELKQFNEGLDAITIGLAGPKLVEVTDYYLPKDILSRFGVPTQVWAMLVYGEPGFPEKTGIGFWVYYEDAHLLIHWYETAIKQDDIYRVCIDHNVSGFTGDPNNNIQLRIQSPDREQNSINEMLESLGGSDKYYTIEQATGLDVEKYFNLVLSKGNESCFKTPISIWSIKGFGE